LVCDPEKNVKNMGFKNWGAKTQDQCYSKREKAAWPLLCFFCNPYFGPFFKVPDPKKISGQPDQLE